MPRPALRRHGGGCARHDLAVEPSVESDDRPWGGYVVLADGEDHKVKRIMVLPGKRLSYQRHERRAEHWFVVSGRGVVTLDGSEMAVTTGSAVDVPAGVAHRVANDGTEPLVFVEVQTGNYFGEDDIQRLEDDFGRVPS
jgi:mannose-6-phosphate isomerase-like protein (cupin superfamily)